MTEAWKSLDRVAEALGLMQELENGLLEHYDLGFKSAMSVMVAGMEAALDHARTLPEAKNYILGLEAAVHAAKGTQEELNKVSHIPNTVTETNGENANG